MQLEGIITRPALCKRAQAMERTRAPTNMPVEASCNPMGEGRSDRGERLIVSRTRRSELCNLSVSSSTLPVKCGLRCLESTPATPQAKADQTGAKA
eukprot:14673190-Alexandrium_andersonii.AAC.1